jgi:uncharacterized protein YjiS (DUF1127 family)
MIDTIALVARLRKNPFAPLHAIALWLELRRCRAHLNGLSDHLLRDIGISRGEIDDVIQYGRHSHR